eukprot:703967-Ditylum_brightwellii.AAC.1
MKNNQSRKRFKSSNAGKKGHIENEAKTVLSTYAFEKLFKIEARRNLQKVEDGMNYIAWPCAYDWDSRHECYDYVNLKLEFDLSKYHIRWMNEFTYQTHVGGPFTIASKEHMLSETVFEDTNSTDDVTRCNSGLTSCHGNGI